MPIRQPFFTPQKEPLLTSELVRLEVRAALEAEKLYLCMSGELDEILTTYPRADQREKAIMDLMLPRLGARFKSGRVEFDVQIQDGLIGLIFRHDARLGGGPNNKDPWARASIPLRLLFDEPGIPDGNGIPISKFTPAKPHVLPEQAALDAYAGKPKSPSVSNNKPAPDRQKPGMRRI